MTIKELREYIRFLPDNTELYHNEIDNPDKEELSFEYIERIDRLEFYVKPKKVNYDIFE